MIKTIALHINKKTFLNRFTINKNGTLNWKDTHLYPSYDKIKTVSGGNLDFFVNTKNRTRNTYPDKNQWLSSQDCGNSCVIWSCKPFELIIYLKTHLRNTNDETEKDTIIGYIGCIVLKLCVFV